VEGPHPSALLRCSSQFRAERQEGTQTRPPDLASGTEEKCQAICFEIRDRAIRKHTPGPFETARGFAGQCADAEGTRRRGHTIRTRRVGRLNATSKKRAKHMFFFVVRFPRSHFQQTIETIVAFVSQLERTVHTNGPGSALSNVYKSPPPPMITARSKLITSYPLADPPLRTLLHTLPRCC